MDIFPEGTTVVPRLVELAPIAMALGDEAAANYCEQSGMTDVVVGRRLCG